MGERGCPDDNDKRLVIGQPHNSRKKSETQILDGGFSKMQGFQKNSWSVGGVHC